MLPQGGVGALKKEKPQEWGGSLWGLCLLFIVFILTGSCSCCFTLFLIERNQQTFFFFFPDFFFPALHFISLLSITSAFILFSPSVYLVFSFAPPHHAISPPPPPPPHTWLSILPHSISLLFSVCTFLDDCNQLALRLAPTGKKKKRKEKKRGARFCLKIKL